MSWVNPLDRLPQIPQDYANHVIYSAGGWLVIMVVMLISLNPHPHIALAIMSVAGAAKKIVDYFKEFESLRMCVAKTVISALGAVIPWAGWMLAVTGHGFKF